jgi:hypothetical protein
VLRVGGDENPRICEQGRARKRMLTGLQRCTGRPASWNASWQPPDAFETSSGGEQPARLIGAPSPAQARPRASLCGVGHPGFVAFAPVAPTIPMTVTWLCDMLDSALAPSMAAAVQRSGSPGGSCIGLLGGLRSGERLDRGAASNSRGRGHGHLASPRICAADARSNGPVLANRPAPYVPQIQRFLFIALAVLFAASFTGAFASPVAFWASPFSS